MSASETPPPSRSSVSPPKSSSTPFIAAVVVMLLLMGGLLFWKLSGSEEPQPVATAAAPPSIAPAAPVLEEPPPPPPPIVEVPDAGAKAVDNGKKGSGVASGGGGCSGECTGTPAGAFTAQLAGVARRAQGCYERALRQNDQLQGRMSVSLRVGPNGSVCNASIGMNQTGDPGLSSCVVQIFRSATFAAPKNGCVEAQVPLNFMPKQ